MTPQGSPEPGDDDGTRNPPDAPDEPATESVGEPQPDEANEDPEEFWRPRWLVPLLLGLVSITAGVVTWRAGQLGSTAAFEDRTAVGQTILAEEQAIEATLGAVDDAVTYVGYVADFAEATALDDLADEVEEQGVQETPRVLRIAAEENRSVATREAAAAGVFGRQTILRQTASGTEEPLPFDITEQRDKLLAEAASGVTAPGVLDPDKWAAAADDTRDRVRGLRFASLLLIGAVAALTVAQLSRDRNLRIGAMVLGTTTWVVVTVATLVTVF